MIKRDLQADVLASLQHFPAVGLIGARQVGKTTLAQAIAESWPGESVYLDLERPADYAVLSEADRSLERYLHHLVIIDEIQVLPSLFPILRGLIDRDRRPGRFLLLGSSSPDLIRQSGESLAGRIAYHELPPFVEHEVGCKLGDTLWLRGGFPLSFLAATDAVSLQWREDFMMTYLQRDLSVMGYDIRLPAMTLRRLWQMLAHSHGQLLNISMLATNLEMSRQSLRKYLDILEETFMIRQLRPYHLNLKKRLVKTAKVYVRDSGILHALLGIKTWTDLLGHTIVGGSWEGFGIEQILSQLPRQWEASFYRTQAKAEVDLVLQRGFGNRPILVEFKYSTAPKLTKGFWTSKNDLDPVACYVVYSGQRQYPLAEDIEVLPISQIDRIWKDTNES